MVILARIAEKEKVLFKKYTGVSLLWLLMSVTSVMATAEVEMPPKKIAERSAAENPDNSPVNKLQKLSQQCASLPSVPPLFVDGLWAVENAGLWRRPGSLAELGIEVAALAEDGLDPEHYFLPQLLGFASNLAAGGQLSDCDSILASYSFISALHDLAFGRVNPQKAGFIWFEEKEKNAADQRIFHDRIAAGVAGIGAAFSEARPTLPQYQNLRKAYRQAAISLPESWTSVPAGASLAEGDRDARVRLLRMRLYEQDFLPTGEADDAEIFDPQLRGAVTEFQRQYGLVVDGIVGKNTLAALSLSPRQLLAKIRVNLERMRWLAREMSTDLLLVDIAGARLAYYRDGQVVWSALAQVGRPTRKTPGLKTTITHVTLNPNWTVPPTIFRHDKLPEIRKDPAYLQKNHIRVFSREGQILDPSKINWNNPGAIVLRQDSGADSALGLVAIRFPNPFAVYLHDTPNRHLFATPGRFYSSGCVRVEHAMELTELFFSDASQQVLSTFSAVRASGKTRNLNVPRPVDILMLYWTAEANDEGAIRYRPDIYVEDERLLRLLERPR